MNNSAKAVEIFLRSDMAREYPITQYLDGSFEMKKETLITILKDFYQFAKEQELNDPETEIGKYKEVALGATGDVFKWVYKEATGKDLSMEDCEQMIKDWIHPKTKSSKGKK